MRKKLLIGLAVYLAVGVLFGLTTGRHKYMCPSSVEVFAPDIAIESGDTGFLLFGASGDSDALEEEVGPLCFPIFSTADRLQWVAITTPAWLPLVIRNIVRGDGIQIGDSNILGQTPL